MSAQSDRLTQRLAQLSSRRRDAAAAARRRQNVIQGSIRAALSGADTNPAETPDAPTVTTLSSSTTKRVGVYFRKDTYEDAKRAHYSDYLAGEFDSPGALSRWIGTAITEHAHRTPQQRSQIAASLPVEPGGEASTRSLALTEHEAQLRMDAAAADRAHRGREWGGSDVVVEAVRYRIERARNRDGGTLADPPASGKGRNGYTHPRQP